MAGIDLGDLVVDDGVADGEVGADELVEVEGPHVVVLLVESPVGLLEADGCSRDDVAALLDDLRLRQTAERVEARVDGDGLEEHDLAAVRRGARRASRWWSCRARRCTPATRSSGLCGRARDTGTAVPAPRSRGSSRR